MIKATSQQPPYTITLGAADYLAKIVETVTRLELGTGFKRDIKLHRKNRVRTIHSSLAIEGNSLSLDEVSAVIEGKIVAGKQTEIKEVKNAYEAYDRIMTFDPYAVKDFLKAHELMTAGLVKESGKFRGGDVGVFDGGVAVHIGARPRFVPRLIEELFNPDISWGFVARRRKRAWLQGARSEGDEGILDDMPRRSNKRNAVDMPDCAAVVETL
jgi:Fic family protein